MNHYTHFTLKEREILKHFIDIGKNQTEISILLGKNKSSISREIKRNSQNGDVKMIGVYIKIRYTIFSACLTFVPIIL